MTPCSQPASVTELIECVRGATRVSVSGRGTKARLADAPKDFDRISTRQLAGVVEYEPDEYIITTWSGTPVAVLAEVLRERGQYLPFDPMFAEAGATIGGTVAAGSNGPGRLRFGGIRDFILGVRLLDGQGRLLRMGGKVVKNAAGFDLPKFLVGSIGRYAVLTEVTLKVFPRPPAAATLRLSSESTEAGLRLLKELPRGRWQPDALEFVAADHAVYMRLTGPADALPLLAHDILNRSPGEVMPPDAAAAFWSDAAEARWAHPDGVLVKVPLTSSQLGPLIDLANRLEEARLRASAAGSVAFISLPATTKVGPLDDYLKAHDLTGLVFRGNVPLWLGSNPRTEIGTAIKAALDPQHRFPALDG